MVLRARVGICFGLLLVLASGAATASAASWKPVNPAELAMTAPKVDKSADAEVLAWEIRVADDVQAESFRSAYDHYLRVKIFTERGRDAFARVDIPHLGSVHVYDVEARTVRPDGSAVEVKKGDIFERDIVKTNGLKVRAVSFSPPALERGSIVEYRWRESHGDETMNYLRLPFAREYPVHQVTYRVKPLDLSGTTLTMTALPFHGNFRDIERDGEYWVMSLSNVPAFHEEPNAPSEWELKPWVLLYYRDRADTSDPAAFWDRTGREFWEADRKVTNPTGAIRNAAQAAIAKAATLDERIAGLLAAARARIVRTDINPKSTGETKKRKPAKHAGEAFDRGEGSGHDLVNVFLAMARAVDLDARGAYVPSRDDVPWDASLMLPYFLDFRVAAVRDGERWRFLDPANHYDAAGALKWSAEGQPAMIAGEQGMLKATTPQAPPDRSVRKRSAVLTLSEDGTLEGDVHNEYLGHLGVLFKASEDSLSEEERVKQVREQLLERLPGGTFENIRIEHVSERDAPYTVKYHLRIPGYAQRTGSRLFLQPALFQKGLPPDFAALTRTHPVAFRFGWSERDEIRITLPPGFSVETAEAPAPLVMPAVARLETKLVTAGDSTRLDVVRSFTFGDGNRLRFPSANYATVKGFFDAVQKQAEHSITLRKNGAGQ